MTVSNQQVRVSYTGDGTSVDFPIPFPFFATTDLLVIQGGSAIVTGYSTAGGAGSTGTLFMASAVPTGVSLQIVLNNPLTQIVALVDGTAFPSATLNEVNDRIVQIALRLADRLTRTLRAPDGDVSPNMLLPPAASRALMNLGFDVGGNLALSQQLATGTLSAATIGLFLYPQSAGESAAGVTPSAYQYPPLNPLRYGCVGDGTTDDSAGMAILGNVINATPNPTVIFPGAKTFLMQFFPVLAAPNLTIQGNGCALKILPGSWPTSGDGITVINITGAGARITDLTVDGNQVNWAPAAWRGRLIQWANDVRMVNCTFKNSAFQGARTGGARAQLTNCHFDDNANLGLEFDTASYQEFSGCTFNRNGYGVNGTWKASGPVGGAVGAALRFRTHHCVFVGCEFNTNGIDGLMNGQGSYAIKVIGCSASFNNDGGFTLHNDSTAPGTPGDGEVPYDAEYVDCEAYNNWGSGLVSYCGSVNISVLGGRYYNNWRAAGILPLVSAGVNGIYFATGSLGIQLRTKAYDDRQLSGISGATGTSPRVLTLSNWTAGTMASYPRVAIYNASSVFQGYATISAEGTNTVSLTAVANNGATLASIVPGWIVTQRLQHNGAFLDNGVQGTLEIDGFGQLGGPQPYMGWKSISGYNDNGQNVLLPSATLQGPELLANASFDADVTNWTFSNPSGSAANYYTTAGTNIRSPGALQLVGGTSLANNGDSTLIANALNYAQGAWVESAMWVNAVNAGDALIELFWNAGSGVLGTAVQHPGGGYKYLKVGGFVPSGITQLFLRVSSAAGKTNYFDVGSLRVKADSVDNRDFVFPTRNLPV